MHDTSKCTPCAMMLRHEIGFLLTWPQTFLELEKQAFLEFSNLGKKIKIHDFAGRKIL